MKKILFAAFILLGLLLLVIVSRSFWLQPVTTPAAVDLGITMLPATVAVDSDLQQAVALALAQQAPERRVWAYGITDVTTQADYWQVSVAGMPVDSQAVRLADSIWLGLVTIRNTPGLPGQVETQMPMVANTLPQALGADVDPAQYGIGGATAVLPFRDGTTAVYGTLGVHDCGFSLSGWRAVDLFPAENMVYSSQAGDVGYVCRDENQVALRVGGNLYTHLEDTGQQIGDSYTQGQAMAAMVPGSYDTACGYAAQGAQAYHVHFCFVPNSLGLYSADGYLLSDATDNWTKGEETVEPLGTLTADWADAAILAGNAPPSNFWDSFIGGIMSMANNAMAALPVHQPMNMVATVSANVSPALQLIQLVFFSNFDMTVFLWVLGIIFVLETVRIVYAGWMWIKRAIPIIG